MAFIASIVSSLPAVGDPATSGHYYQYGAGDIPVFIGVTNTDLVDRVVKQMYVTQLESAFGTGAALGIGDAAFRYIPSSLNTTNNIIPASTGRTIENLIKPQINATQWSEGYYEFQIIPVVQEVGSNSTIPYAAPVRFRIYRSAAVAYEITNKYLLWDRATNKRPPQNADFDWQLGLIEILETGERIQVATERLTWTRSPINTFLSVDATSDGTNTQNNPYDPLVNPQEYAIFAANTQFVSSAGSITIANNNDIGTCTVFASVAGVIGTVASTVINVRNSVPVSLKINQVSVPFRFSTNFETALFKIFLTYSDGSVEDISLDTTNCTVTFPIPPISFGAATTTTIGGIGYRGFVITNFSSTYLSLFSPTEIPLTIVYDDGTSRIRLQQNLLLQKII